MNHVEGRRCGLVPRVGGFLERPLFFPSLGRLQCRSPEGLDVSYLNYTCNQKAIRFMTLKRMASFANRNLHASHKCETYSAGSCVCANGGAYFSKDAFDWFQFQFCFCKQGFGILCSIGVESSEWNGGFAFGFFYD